MIPRTTRRDAAPSAAVDAGPDRTGHPLPDGLQSRLGAALGTDLSSVRLHTDSASAASAADLGAHAYAVSQDIHFGAGKYDPDSIEGQRLIAHEVAHTVQQGSSLSRAQCDLEVSEAGDASEIEADRFADSFVAGETAGVTPAATGAVIQRHPSEEEDDALRWYETVPARIAREIRTARTSLPTEEVRQHALRTLENASRRHERFAEGSRRYMESNTLAFLEDTHDNPRLGWSRNLLANTMQSILSGGLDSVAQQGFEAAAGRATAAGSAALGAALGGVPGAIVGFAVGVFIDQAVSLISEQIFGSDEERAATDAGARALRGYREKAREFNTARDRAVAAFHDQRSPMFQRASDARTPKEELLEVWELAEDLNGRLHDPPASDLGLAQLWLHDWVLEHAGDEEDADRLTPEDQWKAARAKVFASDGDLDDHPELFAYQTRGHWKGMGVTDAREVSWLIHDGDEYREQVLAGGYEEHPADAAEREYDRRKMTLYDKENPAAFMAVFDEKYSFFPAEVLARYRASFCERPYDVDVECTLDLTTSDGSCYVNRWWYAVSFPAIRCRNGHETGPSTYSFQITPD